MGESQELAGVAGNPPDDPERTGRAEGAGLQPGAAHGVSPGMTAPTTPQMAPSPWLAVGGPAGNRGGRAWPWLLAALICGLLRFWRLGDWSLWYDEAITWADANHAAASGGMKNPLGYALVRWCVELRGGVPDEFTMRLLPALAGYLCIPLCVWALRPLIGGRRAGIAALLLSVSTWELYWCQNARFYTMAQLLGLIGGGLLLRGVIHGAGRAALLKLVAGVLLTAVGVFFHPSTALLVGALILAPFVLRQWLGPLPGASQAAMRPLLILAIVAAVGGAGWLYDFWITYEKIKGIGDTPGANLAGAAHLILSFGFYLSPLWGIAVLIGALQAWRGRERGMLLVLILCVAGFAIALLASMFARVTAQYVFVLLPWILALAARSVDGVQALHSTRQADQDPAHGSRTCAWVLLLAAPALVDSGLYFQLRHGERPRWREAYQYVWQERGENDLVMGMAAPIAEYYLAPDNTNLRNPTAVAWLDRWRSDLPMRWSKSNRRQWIVICPENLKDWSADKRRSFEEYLHTEFQLKRRFPVQATGRDLSLEVYLRE